MLIASWSCCIAGWEVGLPAENINLPAEIFGLPAENIGLPAENIGLPTENFSSIQPMAELVGWGGGAGSAQLFFALLLPKFTQANPKIPLKDKN